MGKVLESLIDKIAEEIGNMHCPICKAVNLVHGGIQIKCWSCGCWSHVDNWTYTKAAWARIEAKNKKRAELMRFKG